LGLLGPVLLAWLPPKNSAIKAGKLRFMTAMTGQVVY